MAASCGRRERASASACSIAARVSSCPGWRARIALAVASALVEAGAAGQRQHQHGEHAGAELPGRVAVRQPREIGGELEDVLRRLRHLGHPQEQADRRDAHHAAAALAVVVGPAVARVDGAQRLQAGDAGRAPAVELGLLDQPAVAPGRLGDDFRGRLVLGAQPAQVGVARDARHRRDALEAQAHPRAQQPLRREQRHLGVVGDPACPAEGRRVQW
jgi:hypothetical protein